MADAALDGLRTIAVYVVVALHGGLASWSGGFVGVDLFFVLSGFLVTSVLLDRLARHGELRLPRFCARRVRRLLPAAATCIVARRSPTSSSCRQRLGRRRWAVLAPRPLRGLPAAAPRRHRRGPAGAPPRFGADCPAGIPRRGIPRPPARRKPAPTTSTPTTAPMPG